MTLKRFLEMLDNSRYCEIWLYLNKKRVATSEAEQNHFNTFDKYLYYTVKSFEFLSSGYYDCSTENSVNVYLIENENVETANIAYEIARKNYDEYMRGRQ